MKHYKIINDNMQQYGGGSELVGLSYNVSWEAMTSNTEGRFRLCTSKLGEGFCKMNILENIEYNLNKYNPDFATFQEASEYEDIIDLSW
jgi:hypothetical protein